MHDAERLAIDAEPVVRVLQARRRTRDDRQRAADRHLALELVRAVHQLAHRLPVDVLHREEVRVAELPGVEHLRDVGVLELGGEPGLVEEHVDMLDVRGAMTEHALQHDVTLDACLALGPRQEDLGHATHGEPCQDLVAVGRRASLCSQVGHARVV